MYIHHMHLKYIHILYLYCISLLTPLSNIQKVRTLCLPVCYYKPASLPKSCLQCLLLYKNTVPSLSHIAPLILLMSNTGVSF